MSEIIAGIDAIVFRGFSREQAIKIYFANHPEAIFDPTQSYTNSATGNHQPIQNSSNVCNGENDKAGDSDSEYGDLDTSYMNSEKNTYPKPYGTESQKGPARVLTRVGSRSEIQANLNPTMYPQDSGSVHGDEDPEIDLLMSRGYTREQAVEVFNQRRRTNKDAPTRSLSRVNSGFSAAQGSSLAEHEEFEVQVLMAKGYTREQATEMLFSRNKASNAINNNQTANKPPAHVRRPSDTAKLSEFVSKNSSSFGATSTVTNTTTTTTIGEAQSPLSSPEVPKFKSLGSRKASKMEMELTTADEAEIALLMGQGYPRVVATQMYIQKGKMGGLSSKIVETNANLSNLTHVPGEGDDIARFGSRAPTPDRERVITAADYGDLSGVNMDQLSLQPNTGSQRRGHSRTPSLAGSEMGALLNERSAIPERVQQAHQGNEFPLTLSSSNLNNNNSNQRGHSRTNSITGSVTYEHSVTLNDDEAAYVTLLMGRGYTEEQAVLAMQQRSQTNSGNSTWNTNNSGSNNNRSPTQGLPPQPSPRLQVMRAGAAGSANISPNTSTYGFTSNGSNYINNGNNSNNSNNSNNNSANAFPTHHLGSRTASGNKLDRSNSGGSNYDEGGRHLRSNSNMSDSFYQSLPPPPQGHVRRGSRVSEVGDNEYAPPGTPGYTSKEQYDLGEWMLKGYTEEQSVEMVLAQREREQAKRERQLSAPPTPPLQYQQPPPPQRAAQRSLPNSPGPAAQYSGTPLSPDEEAFRIGLLVSEQESEFGVNMYDNITPEDEAEIDRLHSMGYTTDDAVLLIFQRTHRSRNPNTYIPVPTLNLQPQRRESMTPYQQQQAPSPPNPQYQQQPQSRQQRSVTRGSVTSTSSYGDFPTQTLPPQSQGSRHMRSNSNTSNGSDIPDRQQQDRPTHLDMYGNPAYSPEQKEKKTHKFFHKPSFLKKKKESKEVSPPSSQYDLHNQSGYNAHSQSQHNMSQNNMSAHNQSQHSMQGYQSQHNMQSHPSIQSHPSNHNMQPYSSNYNMQYPPPPPQYYGPQDPPRQAYNQQYAHNQPYGHNQPHTYSEPHYRPAETEEEKNMRKRLGYREEDVQILCDMGYAKDQAVQALVENDQNVGRAAEMLMRS